VNHDEQLAFQREHDPLAQPAHVDHRSSLDRAERRIDGAQHERMHDAHAQELAALHTFEQRLAIELDVGKLGHRA